MEEISTLAYCCSELSFNLINFLLQARALETRFSGINEGCGR